MKTKIQFQIIDIGAFNAKQTEFVYIHLPRLAIRNRYLNSFVGIEDTFCTSPVTDFLYILPRSKTWVLKQWSRQMKINFVSFFWILFQNPTTNRSQVLVEYNILIINIKKETCQKVQQKAFWLPNYVSLVFWNYVFFKESWITYIMLNMRI